MDSARSGEPPELRLAQATARLSYGLPEPVLGTDRPCLLACSTFQVSWRVHGSHTSGSKCSHTGGVPDAAVCLLGLIRWVPVSSRLKKAGVNHLSIG